MKSANSLKIYILENDLSYGLMLRDYLLLHPQFDVKHFEQSRELFDHLHERPDVVAINYSMPDMDGAEVLKKVRDKHPEMRVIVIAGSGNANAASLLKKGAFDYISKDDHTRDRLYNSLSHMLEMDRLRYEVDQLREQLCKRYDFSKILIGESPAMEEVYALVDMATRTSHTLVITGEKGTGKEMVARAIHYNSYKSKQPFVSVNLAAIARERLEAELFGYEKGAFPGAETRVVGRIEEAHNGTLLLDEVSELDIHLQGRLLQVLQTQEIVRMGGNERIPVNVRFIFSTHRNLEEEVQQKRFREDLYQYVGGKRIHLPPLRERGNDVLLMARHFAEERCQANNVAVKSLSTEAQQMLLNYSFPRNVRELKSMMQLAVELAEGDTILPQHISIHAGRSATNLIGEERTLKEYEIQIIQHYLDKYDHDVLRVAKKLDVGKSTIYRMIQAGLLTK